MYSNTCVMHAQIQTIHTVGGTHIILQNARPTSAISPTQHATTFKIKNSKYDTYAIQNWTHIIYVNGYVMHEQLQTVHIVRSTHISSPIQVKVRSPQEQPSAGAPAAQAPYVLTS